MFQRQSGYLWWKLIALLARCRRSFWHDLRKREGGRGETFWKTPVLWKTFGGARDKQKGGNTSSQCWSPRQIWPWTTGKKQQIYVNCGKYDTEQQDPEDVQVPAAHGRWQGEGGRLLVSIFWFPFLLQAKVILGFTTSVGLEEMSIELIHQKFMAKLQLVATCNNSVDKDFCQRSSTCNSNLSQDFF